VNAATQPFQFVLYSEFFFFERRDPDFIPIGIGHFGVDRVFETFVLFGEFLDMPLLKRHAKPLHLGVIIRSQLPSPVTPHFRPCLRRGKGNP
jgi:hypothetical protein